ncbi:MAG: glycogen/starch synthase [Bacteroidia bacterium]|nr:glycogen/starch synthase [Bacteroidia bacterium]
MEKTKVLFVFQEITPYLPETDMSYIGRYLPQGVQESGKEIRTFMPKYGVINERRNQLHEVIRLSGMNMIISDTDHPLIIKVASIQSARMQVYFIDNEDYFQRRNILRDDHNKSFHDNDERAIFYVRGVLETVKKLRWAPEIIHCHGWISSLVPLYVKKSFREDPLFHESKVIYSIYNDDFEKALDRKFKDKLKIDGIREKDVALIKKPDYVNINKLAITHADGIIIASESINPEVMDFVNSSGKPVLPFQTRENFINAYSVFYQKLLDSRS